MSDKNNSKNKEPYIMREVDPDVEAKVDALMTGEAAKLPEAKPVDAPQVPPENVSAPLLPGEKLPDFDKKSPPAKAPTQSNAEPAKEPVVPEEPLKDEAGVEDASTNDAVDEIVAEESDRLIAIDDAKAELSAGGVAFKKKNFLAKIKSKIADFWHNPLKRNLALASAFIVISVIAVVPASRYFTLNLFGVRASTSLKIVDEKTGQPLKNVEISIGDKTSKTDIDGQAKLEKIKLGPQEIIAKKPAFADSEQKVTIGWGSNPLRDVKLTAVGSRYTINVTDFLSGKPVKAEATSGEASAVANDQGEIALVVADKDEGNVDVYIAADNYRTETLSLPVGEKDVQNLQMAPSKKQAFVSKRSGKYDLYKIDVDGKNEEMVFAGTGSEKEDGMIIMSHQTKDIVAFVSTRGDKFNKDGFALSSLNLIDLTDDKVTKIAQSERIQLIDFIGDKLVYVKIKEGESAASTDRHRLISYDVQTGEEKELAKTNYFNDVISAGGVIYYAPAVYQVDGQVGLFSINPDGTDKYSIFGSEVWNLFRTSHNKIAASVQQDWYEYDIHTTQFNKSEGAPPVLKSRVYADSPDKSKSAWVDERDGKGVLLIYSNDTNEDDKVLMIQSGLSNPIHWLDDEHLVYRVSNNSETADYVIDINGGDPKKISDVTNTAGLDRWYYY